MVSSITQLPTPGMLPLPVEKASTIVNLASTIERCLFFAGYPEAEGLSHTPMFEHWQNSVHFPTFTEFNYDSLRMWVRRYVEPSGVLVKTRPRFDYEYRMSPGGNLFARGVSGLLLDWALKHVDDEIYLDEVLSNSQQTRKKEWNQDGYGTLAYRVALLEALCSVSSHGAKPSELVAYLDERGIKRHQSTAIYNIDLLEDANVVHYGKNEPSIVVLGTRSELQEIASRAIPHQMPSRTIIRKTLVGILLDPDLGELTFDTVRTILTDLVTEERYISDPCIYKNIRDLLEELHALNLVKLNRVEGIQYRDYAVAFNGGEAMIASRELAEIYQAVFSGDVIKLRHGAQTGKEIVKDRDKMRRLLTTPNRRDRIRTRSY